MQWMPIFHPEYFIEDRDISAGELVLDDDGQVIAPNLEGVTIKWKDKITPKEAEEIFKELLGDTNGTLTAEDTLKLINNDDAPDS